MDEYNERAFYEIDAAVLDGVRKAKQRNLEPLSLRLSPAALDIMRAHPSALFDMVDNSKHGYIWRGLSIIVEAGLPIGRPSEYEEVKVCIEAKQHGEHGRHFYFDADTTRFPKRLTLNAVFSSE